MYDVVDKVLAIQWKYLVSRRESVLMGSITDNAYAFFEQATGISWKANDILRLGSGELYHNQEELETLSALIKEGGIVLLEKFKKRLIFTLSKFEEISLHIQKKSYLHATDEEITKDYQIFLEHAFLAHNFLLPFPIADKILSSRIKDNLPTDSDTLKEEWLSILTYPNKENEHIREERSFYNLVRLYADDDTTFEAMLQEHLTHFSWIGARWYWWKHAWTKDDILSRIRSFIAQGKNPTEELEKLEKFREEQCKKEKLSLNEIGILESTQLSDLIRLAKEFAYRRTWRSDIIYQAGYRARGLFYEIARRCAILEDDIVYLTNQEISLLLSKKYRGLEQNIIESRKTSCTKVTLDGNYTLYSGKEWEGKFSEIVNVQLKDEVEVKGKAAYQGTLRGRAKIVLGVDDLTRVERGDVLISVMTFPHFISAMEKAAAFVTDEGGILCHAAIIAREFQKPCVVGTQYATKIFKDGDLVEVDAQAGIVRKIL